MISFIKTFTKKTKCLSVDGKSSFEARHSLLTNNFTHKKKSIPTVTFSSLQY